MKNKIPPPILTLLCIYFIYAMDELSPNFTFTYQDIFAYFIGVEALLIIFFGIKEFKGTKMTRVDKIVFLASFECHDYRSVFSFTLTPTT